MLTPSRDVVCACQHHPAASAGRRRLGLCCLAAVLCAVGGCNGGKAHELWNDAFDCHGDSAGGGNGDTTPPPPRPPANAASESLVQASGDTQTDPGAVIENSSIIGEPLEAGAPASAGTAIVRHGFAPPIPPGWPSGVARVEPAAHANPQRD